MVAEVIKASEVMRLLGVAPSVAPPDVPTQIPAPNAPSATLATYASPMQGGAAHGDGQFTQGSTVLVAALPTENYIFVNWIYPNGLVASSEAEYAFTLTGNTTLTANFAFSPPRYPPGVPWNVYRQIIGHITAANASRHVINEYIPPEEDPPLQHHGKPVPKH